MPSKGRRSPWFFFFFFPTSSSILSTAPALVFASLPHLVCSVDLHLSSITHFYKALEFHRITLDVVPSPLVKFNNPHYHFQMTAVHSPIFISHNNFLFSSSNVHMSLSSVGLLWPVTTLPKIAPITHLAVNLSFCFLFFCSASTWYYIVCLLGYLIMVCHWC